ncbi:glycerophosphodiester phosphodiesterase [Haladaptatus sp. T7]|uniref:glycerophosphodiester phosphodiesterase n=1 Tax=Haladaptatus sp. T7 TaxID=2029368 RepID=UPI0021A2541D|nr:glycerophosphodiester phosphodiesterase [Haladaptatus sp. T7]GKZ15599.1 glycerophosphoryl diester phosphodiesterase [Haladaptatus sp. T7]
MVSERLQALNRRTFVGTGAAVASTALAGVGTAQQRCSDDDEGDHGADDDHGRGGGDDEDDITYVAHRGYKGLHPENTLRAFEAASRTADMIELDIMPCADGEIVVFHDEKLGARDGGTRGLTDQHGYVWENDCETVLNANVLGSGETVPLLSEALAAIPNHVDVNIEFKNPGSAAAQSSTNLSGAELEAGKERWRSFTEDALDIVAEHGNDVLVSSFYEAAIATVREVNPDIPVGYLLWDSIERGLDIVREYDCEAVNPPYNMVKGSPFFDDPYYLDDPDFADIDLVQVAHDEGREVNVYTLDTWYQADQLAKAGVDGLIVNYPNLLRE